MRITPDQRAKIDSLYCERPIYDLTCKFMYQETSKLVSEKAYFFGHYNIDSDEA